jgi:hypothetical protein
MTKPKSPGRPGQATKPMTSGGRKSAPFLLRKGPPAKSSASAKTNEPGRAPLLVFGLDQAGKPKAGRFPDRHATLARKAALALNLNAYPMDRPKLVELASQIPVGRIHAQGKAFIPSIKQGLFDQIRQAVNPATTMAAAAKAGPQVTMAPTNRQPKDWDSIGVGDLVLCTEGPREGFWEAFIVARDGDKISCQFRDYPRQPVYECSIDDIALMHVRKG